MNNSAVLKDELSLLKTDVSAVLIELRKLSDELNVVHVKISDANKELAEILKQKNQEAAELNAAREALKEINKELKNKRLESISLSKSLDSNSVKRTQLEKDHLGRIGAVS